MSVSPRRLRTDATCVRAQIAEELTSASGQSAPGSPLEPPVKLGAARLVAEEPVANAAATAKHESPRRKGEET